MTQVSEELLRLAERCEKATLPCPDDASAAEMVAVRSAISRLVDRRGYDAYSPDYVGSLDAAMTLVPEGWSITLFIASKHHTTRCTLAGNGETIEASEQIVAVSRTPALALCAAALKARNADAPEPQFSSPGGTNDTTK